MNQILLVEDESPFVDLIVKECADLGEFLIAHSIEDVVSILSSQPIAAVLSDFKLNGFTGYDVAKIAMRMRPAPPVLIMTAFATKSLAIEAVNRGIFAFLEKPFPMDLLRTYLLSALRKSDARSGRADGELSLNPSSLSVNWEDAEIPLTRKEFQIIALLLSASSWISRESLERHLWSNRSLSRNTFDTHLTNLKKKIPILKDRLQFLRGRGYQLKGL